MSWQFRPGQDFDSALDSIGQTFVDRVPVQINPIYVRPTSLIREVESLLSRPTPGEHLVTNGLESTQHNFDGRLERQVLQQLKVIDDAKLQREEKARQDQEEYEQLKKKEEEEEEERKRKQLEEEEKKKKEEEEKVINGKSEENGSLSEEEESLKPVEKPASAPPQRVNLPNVGDSNAIQAMSNLAVSPIARNAVQQSPASQMTRFNFSEFEGESDPFDSMQLKTIDEKRELAAVLQKTKPNNPTNQHVNPFYPGYQQPNFPQQHSPYFPGQTMPTVNAFPPPPRPSYYPYPMPTSNFTSPGTHTQEQSSMKSSKSVGDLVSEVKKEEEKKTFAENVKSKQPSFTPPPRVGAAAGARSGLEDWVPWPELDEVKDPYSVLSTDKEKQLCKQIHEMGFPLERVLRICQALGTSKEDAGQQMINFCLLVDKFVTAEGFEESETEHVLLIKSFDEEETRKHLLGFRKLKDLGFPSKAVHDALVECQSDQEKALEKLLA